MKVNDRWIFQDVEALSRSILAEKGSRERFRLEIDFRDACRGIYAAMDAAIKSRGGVMVFDADTRRHIESAAQWLTDPSGKPGLFLCGLFGNGKTTLAKAIAWLVAYVSERELGYGNRMNMPVKTAKEIAKMCVAADRNDRCRESYEELFSTPLLCIDELGGEPTEVLSFGMPLTPLVDILSERYSRQLVTVVTTNLNTDEIKEKYGARIYDRFKEMMCVIVFENDSYRGFKPLSGSLKVEEVENQEEKQG